jgi:hypothetical protein
MYNLDFETMKQVMQEHQTTGFLYADVPADATSMHEPCRIEINLKEGTIVSCSIVGKSGRRLPGKNTARELSRLGSLSWNLASQQGAIAQQGSLTPTPATAPVEIPFFPKRADSLEQGQMRSWPRLHRAVFALADGTKTAEKIADMLSASPSSVYGVLRDLQSAGFITVVR